MCACTCVRVRTCTHVYVLYHVRVYVCTIYISFFNISMLLYSVTLTYNVFLYINSSKVIGYNIKKITLLPTDKVLIYSNIV